ncbi:hypothetical protein D3C85_128260 [compost metagenome]
MFKYNKAQADVFLQLVNEANPGLVEERDIINSRFGTPVVRTPGAGEIQDTSVSIYATESSFYIGKRVLTYRRLDLGKMFANAVLELDQWTSNSLLTPTQFCEEVNKKYGLALTVDDIPTANRGSVGTLQQMSIQPNSLLYKGTVFFRWLMGKRTINEIMGSYKPPGLKWDVGLVQGKPLMTFQGYGVDYSGQISSINQLAVSNTLSSANGHQKALINKLVAYTGIPFDLTKSHTAEYGLAGLILTKVTIPADTAIEANSAKYNRVLMITAAADSWFCGKLLLHYNV